MLGNLSSLGMLGTLGIDELGWSELFGQQHPSVINTQATNSQDTDISTSNTISLMNEYAYADSQHPTIQSAAQEIRDSAGGNDSDEKAILEATFQYVKDHVTFVEDETILNKLFGIDSDVELLIKPARLLTMRNPMGDCDDFSMLTKSLLIANDVPSSYITVAADKLKPKKWSHVYVLSDESETPIDTSHGKYVGWEAPNVTREQVWNDGESDGGENKRRKIKMTENMLEGISALGNLEGLGDLGDICDTWGCYPEPSASIPSISSSGSGYDWSQILAPLTKAGTQIATAQFGQPQLAPGTFIRTAQGAILTNQPINTGLFTSGGGSGINFGSSGLLIGAVVIIGGLALLGGKR